MSLFSRNSKKKTANENVHKDRTEGVLTLYTATGDAGRTKNAIIEQFSCMTKEIVTSAVSGVDDCFTLCLNDGSEVKLNMITDKTIVSEQITGMRNFFAAAKCSNQALHQNVLVQIQLFNCIIGCTYSIAGETGADCILDAIFAAADKINGLVLTPSMQLLNSERKLVLSIAGESHFESYYPIACADILGDAKDETDSDAARRERSLRILREKGIPNPPQLRSAAMESKAHLRPPAEIAYRLFAMFGVCVYSEARSSGETWEDAQKYLVKINEILEGKLDACLSPKEKAFLSVKEPEQRELVVFGWRYECCYVLLWALGIIDDLGYPDKICDVSKMGNLIWKQNNITGFLNLSKPRAKAEVLDAADLILRYDWACVDARVNRREYPAGLNGEVVMEWHYALNWLVGADGNADWDDVSTDT